MLERLATLLGLDASTDAVEPEHIMPELAAAALMFEVVWADHDIDAKELAAMADHLEQLFKLDRTRIDQIIAQTQDDLEQSVGAQPYTRALNEQLSEDQKVDVVAAMWSIAYADLQVQPLEEHAIRRIADLLYVPHRRYIDAKRTAKARADNHSVNS